MMRGMAGNDPKTKMMINIKKYNYQVKESFSHHLVTFVSDWIHNLNPEIDLVAVQLLIPTRTTSRKYKIVVKLK